MSSADEWEAAWSRYIAALARRDAAKTRAAWKGARLSVAKARKACVRFAPDLMARIER